MAFRVIVAGVPIECDTVDEAIEIARKAGDGTAPRRGSVTDSEAGDLGMSRWTEARVREFMKRIEGKQRKVIDALIEYKDGRTDRQLLDLVGLPDGRALAGVLTGLWKNARKVGADPKDLYDRQRVTIAGHGAYEYTLRESFRRAWSKVQSE